MDATSPHRVPTDILGFDCRAIFADERTLLSHISAILAKKGGWQVIWHVLSTTRSRFEKQFEKLIRKAIHKAIRKKIRKNSQKKIE